jgi:molybdopterin-binding protein
MSEAEFDDVIEFRFAHILSLCALYRSRANLLGLLAICGALCVRCGIRNGGSGFLRNVTRQRARVCAPGEPPMRLSARNQIKGKIVEVRKGATTSHVRVDIGNGNIVTSSITNEAVDELGLKLGGNAIVVIKASDVMIAVD